MDKIVTLCFSLLVLSSCDRFMPAGYWDNFESDLRLEQQSDQGPWGGTRVYFWKSNTKGYFSEKKVLDFAESNGWRLRGTSHFKKSDLNDQNEDGQRSLTIQLGPLEPGRTLMTHSFPRWTNADLTLYRFKAGWLIYKPGTDEHTEVTGFITISADGREMTVYHVWGE